MNGFTVAVRDELFAEVLAELLAASAEIVAADTAAADTVAKYFDVYRR